MRRKKREPFAFSRFNVEKQFNAFAHWINLVQVTMLDVRWDDEKRSGHKRDGLDAVELDYKTSLEDIYTHFASSTALFGTVDPSGVIARGTPADVRRELLIIAERYQGNPRLVLGAGCAIPPITPEENIRALVETIHQLPVE